MYLWNIRALKEDFRRGSINDARVFPYVLAYVIIATIGGSISLLFPNEKVNAWTYAERLVTLIVLITGTIICYHKNGGGNGKRFADKYFSLGFVLGIRFLPWTIPMLGILIVQWEYALPANEYPADTVLDVLLFGLWYSVYYWRLMLHFGDIAEA